MKEKENTQPVNTYTGTESSPENDIDKEFVHAVKSLELVFPEADEPISPEELIEILKEDVVLVLDRPGSWEGAKMRDLLVAHGLY